MTVNATKRLAESRCLDEFVATLISLEPNYVILKVSERIWEAVGEKNSVVVVFKQIRERKCVIKLCKFEVFADLVLKVAYISAVSMPSNLFRISFTFGVD